MDGPVSASRQPGGPAAQPAAPHNLLIPPPAIALGRPLPRHRHQVAQRLHCQLGPLATLLLAKRGSKRLRGQHASPCACRPAVPLGLLQQAQRQLFLAQQYGVRVVHLAGHFIPKLLQLALADDACIAKPAAVGLDAGGRQLLGLKGLDKDVWKGSKGENGWSRVAGVIEVRHRIRRRPSPGSPTPEPARLPRPSTQPKDLVDDAPALVPLGLGVVHLEAADLQRR